MRREKGKNDQILAAKVGRLDTQVDDILSGSFRGTTRPATLAHYTAKVDTMASILRTRLLWATECRAAKGGKDDLETATATIMAVLAELENERPRKEKYSSAYLTGVVRTNYSEKKIARQAKVYVACLTPYPDNLEMWSSAFGGHGYGACIEFQLLKEEHQFSDRGYGLYEVKYDLGELHDTIKALMARVLDVAQRYPICRERDQIVTSGLFRIAAIASTLAKPTSCASQKEWRIILVPAKGANIETSGTPFPRTDFPLRVNSDDLPVVERVVLGPNNSPQTIERVRAQLATLGYGAANGDIPQVVMSSHQPVSANPT